MPDQGIYSRLYSEGQMVSSKSILNKRLSRLGFVGFPIPTLIFLPCNLDLYGPFYEGLYLGTQAKQGFLLWLLEIPSGIGLCFPHDAVTWLTVLTLHLIFLMSSLKNRKEK